MNGHHIDLKQPERHPKKSNRGIVTLLFPFFYILLFSIPCFAQNGAPSTPGTITGPTPSTVYGGQTETYSISAVYQATSYSWYVEPANSASVSTSAGTSVSITWSTSFVGSAIVNVSGVNSYGTGKASQLTVSVGSTLAAGTISPASQTINYNTPAAAITSSSATGSNGVYKYQWYSSPDNTNWTPINNDTTLTCSTPNPLTTTTYYKLETSSDNVNLYTYATVIVYPQLVAGSLSPAVQSIYPGGTAATIISAAPTGGSGTYGYQWSSSPDNNTWTPINNAVTLSYSPGAVSSNMYYKLVTTSNGAPVTTYEAISTSTCPVPNAVFNANMNYVLVSEPRVSGITSPSGYAGLGICQLMQTVQYIDGLGRPLQTIQVRASPTGYDMVQPFQYDQFGRDSVSFLPYTVNETPGAYRPNAIVGTGGTYTSSEQYQFYQQTGQTYVNTPYPYAGKNYEPSDENRVVEQGAPGVSWQLSTAGVSGGGHTVSVSYPVNTQTPFTSATLSNNPGSSSVAEYTTTINSATQTQRLVRAAGSYAAGTLTLTITHDENWNSASDGCLHSTEAYKDMEGQVILKRTYNLIPGDSVQMLSTYYVYDDMGNLAFVLPPAANPDNGGTPSPTVLNNLCYQYQYDLRGRLTAKKVPGKGWEYMMYNVLDQVVMTQDSVQRMKSPQQALYTAYDAQGRVIITGVFTIAATTVQGQNYQSNMQATVNALTTLWETRTATGNGYTTATLPGGFTMLTTNYYDNYTMPNLPTPYASASSPSVMTKGLLTATITAILNTPSQVLWAVHYYDDLGRTTQTFKQDYQGGSASYSTGNFDVVANTYDFTNELTQTIKEHFTTASSSVPTVTVGNTFDYDQAGRKLHTGEQIYVGTTAGTPVYLSLVDYNQLGQVQAKHYHYQAGMNAYLGETAYSYNERGWITALTPINNTNFSETLSYNTASTNPQYNGNIAQFSYNSPYMEYTVTNSQANSNNMNTVNYTYDDLNRLLQSTSTLGVTDETVSYDRVGNIATLSRGGQYVGAYNYNYTSQTNQLATVTNQSGGATFKSYGYDGNGNATSDGGTKMITYNILNLPQTVTQSGSTLVTYYYDATGNKLRTESPAEGQMDYVDNIVYNNGIIAFIQTEEGKAMPTSGNDPSSTGAFDYVYDKKDYLGNVRASYDNGGNVNATSPRLIQENSYYPFGLTTKYWDVSNGNRYLYNGKEQQVDLTYQYDYGWRQYDPVIARWTTVDPLVEKDHHSWTPYAYVYNNPMRFTDPDGRDSTQRAQALNKAQEYVNKNPGNSYQMGAKGDPGQKVDCSGMACKVVVAGGEKDPNRGNSNGVTNIAKNTTPVDEKDVVPGNLVILDGKSHTGIITIVEHDKNGKIVNEQMIDSGGKPESGKSGPRVSNLIKDGKKLYWGQRVDGYRKWDKKPDKTN